MFKMIKKIVSPSSAMHEFNDHTIRPSHIYKEFNMILLEIFDQDIIPFIQPDRFVNGTLYVSCSFDFMEILNKRKEYFLIKLQEIFGEDLIYDVIFEV